LDATAEQRACAGDGAMSEDFWMDIAFYATLLVIAGCTIFTVVISMNEVV
jgi:hypothetical protein